MKIGDLVMAHWNGDKVLGIVTMVASFAERYDRRIKVHWVVKDYQQWENVHALRKVVR
jgi:hypothetical protein